MNFLIEGQENSFSDLEAVIRERNALAFVGSGVSKHAGYPLWWELVEELAQAAGIQLTSEDLESEGLRLIEIVQQCKERLTDARYYDELRRIFKHSPHEPFSLMHVQILEMPFLSFPTTNVDDCHILARNSVRQGWIAGDWDVYPILQIHRLQERRIIYIHGKIEDDERIRSIVLAKSEYENAYRLDGGGAREFLFYALRHLDCVFIGYSMNDIFLRKVIEEAARVLHSEREELMKQGRSLSREPRHFTVLPQLDKLESAQQRSSRLGRQLTPEEIEGMELKRRQTEEFLKPLRITPLYYRVVNQNHSCLNQLVYELNRRLVTDNLQVPE